MKSILFFCLFCFIYCQSFSQFHNYTFEEVTKEELLMKDCPFEPGAPAMLLGEKCGVVNNPQMPYSSIDIKRRVKILTKEGFSYGNIEIEFDHKIDDIVINKAAVYSLQGDRVFMEKVNPDNIIITKIDKHLSKYTITLPNIKIGSVIDIFYKISTYRAMDIEPWYFQSEIPCGWSEYKTMIQKKVSYNYFYTDFLPFTVNTVKDPSQLEEKQAGYVINRFVVENTPSYHLNEPFILRPHDQLSKVEPVYNAIKHNAIWGYSEGPLSWDDIRGNLNKHPQMGKLINRSKILQTELAYTLKDSRDFDDSLRAVYEMVRQRLKCDEHTSIYAWDLDEIWKKKLGNTGDINILLLAALHSAGFDCHPLILTTTEEAPPSKTNPQRSGINFLVAAIFKDSTYYLLDASNREIAFNTLPSFCLNGDGFLISDHPHKQWLPLLRTERFESQTNITFNWSPDKNIKGNAEVKLFSLYANRYRRIIRESGEEEYIKSRKLDFPNYNITDPTYSSLDKTDSAFVENFIFTLKPADYNTTESYFLPVLPFAPYKENPFDAIKRDFRIDFVAPLIRQMNVTIRIPEGYGIANIPESITVDNLNNDLSFDFSVEVSPDQREIVVHSSIRINRYSYSKEEYNILRQFFTEIVKMQNTLIELKKG